MLEAFNPARLKQARLRHALTKVGLAKKVGLSARRIAAFENEGADPPRATIEAIARALDFPIAFFMQPSDPPTLDPADVSFRSYSRLTAGSRDAALAAAQSAFELAAWIDERFALPAPDVPDLRDVQPAEAAAALRSMWGLGEVPAPNLVHLLEAHGVRVFSIVDECAALDAFSMWKWDVPFVFLTRHKTPERARWDSAHELGHLCLHLETPPNGREQEDQADEFARAFLLPEGGVLATAVRYPSLIDVRREKVEWRVSALAYIRQLRHLDVITDWQYRTLVIEATQAGYKRREGDIEREASQLLPKVLQALREEGVTVNDIASDLRLSPADLRGLLFTPLTSLGGGGGTITGSPPQLRLIEAANDEVR